MKYLLAFFFSLLMPALAQATVFFVDPTTTGGCVNGSTTYDPSAEACGSGTSTLYTTIDNALVAGKPAAGDTLYIRAGTYNYIISTATRTLTSGTSFADAPIIAGYPGETVTIQSSGADCIICILSGQYRIIQHLVVNGSGNSGETVTAGFSGASFIKFIDIEVYNTGHHGVFFHPPGGHNIFTQGYVHDIGNLATYPTPPYGHYGFYIEADDNEITNNRIVSTMGFGVHLNDSNTGGSADRNVVARNYFQDTATAVPSDRAIIVARAADAVIDRNIVYSSDGHGIEVGQNGTRAIITHNLVTASAFTGIVIDSGATNVVVANNISVGNTSTNLSNSGTGTTVATNKTTGSLTECTPSASTFTHKSGSTCIDTGTVLSGGYNGTAPDLGPFETIPTPTTATASGNSVDVTLPMSLYTPVLPATGQTTWVVKFGGVARTTQSAVRLTGSDTVVRLTYSGAACLTTDTMTIDYTAGNVTDSALIGNSLNQPLLSFTGLTVNESQCEGSPPPPPPTGGLVVSYTFADGSGPTVTDHSGLGNVGTLTGSPLPTWVSPNGVAFTDEVNHYVAVPYGSGYNIFDNPLTMCWGGFVDPAEAQKVIAAAPNGTNQRFYIGHIGGTWGLGIQGSAFSQGTEFPVTGALTHVCVRADANGEQGTADQAVLFVNGAKGTTSTTVKTYTSFTLAGNLRIGQEPSFVINYGASTATWFKVWEDALTDQEIIDDFNAFSNPSPPSTGTRKQKGHKFQRPYKSVSGSVEDIRGLNSDISLVLNGEVDWLVQTDHTGADPDPYGPRVTFSIDGGATYAQVNDLCGVICFRGESTNTDLVTGTITGTCLTGVLTCILGPTNSTSAAVPNIDVAEDQAFLTRYKLKLGPDATEDQIIYLKLKDQNGNEFEDSAEPSALGAKITVAGNTALNNTFLTSATQPQGFVELAGGAGRTRLTALEIADFMPTTRGAFTFPAPYGTQAARITDATDCSGSTDCVWYIGYSYWMNMNYHVNSTVIKIFVGLDNGDGGTGPNLFELNKSTMGVVKVGPIFGAASPWRNWTGESWYWSGSQENELYINDHLKLYRYNVVTQVMTEVIDVVGQFGANRELRQPHSTPDDSKHVYTLVDSSAGNAPLGCVYYDEILDDATLYTKVGTYDECNITKDGRWTVIIETITGAVDNRIFDNTNGLETRIAANAHSLGHQDTGYNYTVGMDNDANIYSGFNTAITWVFADGGVGNPPNVIGPSGVRFWSSFDTQTNHISHTNAMPNLLAAQRMICGSNATDPGTFTQEDELTCFTLTATLPQQAMIVAPLMTGLDAAGGDIEYAKFPKGNLDVTGKYFIWSTNLRGDRIDVFVTRVPPLLVP